MVRSLITKGLYSTAALAGAGLIYARVEAELFTVRTTTVRILPPAAPTLKILHISDLHFASEAPRKAAWIARLAELMPDAVIVTGDNLSSTAGLAGLASSLAPLLSVPGAFVYGSNDYYSALPKNPARYLSAGRHTSSPTTRVPDLPTARMTKFLQSGGWKDANNARSSILTENGITIDLVGLADPHSGSDQMPAPSTKPAEALLRLGIVHAPYRRALDALTDDGAGLILTGHTHGGQLRVPGYGALVTNADIHRRFAHGLHRWTSPDTGASSWVNISAGIGTSPYTPVRFACRPEVSLITLLPF